MGRPFESLEYLELEEFAQEAEGRELVSAVVNGEASTDNSNYCFVFVADHPHGPYVRIDTEKRRDFLAKKTEQQAQDDLIALTRKTRTLTGGFIGIHPFSGAVSGTKLTPVAPGFLTELEQPDHDLSMFIYFNDNGHGFDARLTEEAKRVGTMFAIPSASANRHMAYLEALRGGNPNQDSRDTAIVNNLEREWMAEFRRYNHVEIGTPIAYVQPVIDSFKQIVLRKDVPEKIPPVMELTPSTVVKTMRSLEKTGLGNIVVSRANFFI